ncbi:MAG: PEP-utilizing enzyme [Candidatus Paceibacterota bacterium]
MNNLEKFEKAMVGSKLTKQEGNFSILIYGSILPCAFSPIINKYYDFDFISVLFLIDSEYGGLFFNMNRYYKTTESTFNKILKQNGEKPEEILDYEGLWKEIEDLYLSNHPKDLELKNDNEIETLIKKSFLNIAKIVGSTVFVEALDKDITYKLYKDIGGDEDKFEDFFQIGSLSAFESFALRFDQSLINTNENEDIYKSQYLFCDYYLAPTLKEIEDKVKKEISKEGGIDGLKKDISEKKQKIEKNKEKVEEFKSNLREKEKYLLEYMQSSMYIRDIRKEPIQKINTLISNLMREYFKRRDFNLDNIAYVSCYDFEDGTYKQNNYEDILNKRKNGVNIFINSNGYNFEYGNILKVKQKIYGIMDKDKDITKVSGNTACKGEAKGNVRVIINESDFSKFKEGDILVTSMTRPEFIPIMKKASAVITDEGGVTCHAAIVSRELNIPCIIGTENATRTLKDGDKVEVNADEGVVKIIEKNNE